MLTLAVTKGWKVQQVDINNVFLKGDLQEQVFIQQPEGFVHPDKPHFVCKLKKALYGLKQAPKAWYDTLHTFLKESGFHHSSSDHCLFHRNVNNKMILILVYVDDILITGDDDTMVQQLIKNLDAKFSLKHLGEVNYFLGIEAKISPSAITLTQSKYIHDLLLRTKLDKSKPCPSPTCPGLKLSKSDSTPFDQPSLFRSVVGALQYLQLTRPDISFSVNKLSQFLQEPTQNHWMACKRILRYLRGTISHGISFVPVSNFCLQGYADADYAASLDDRRSTSGFCVTLGPNLLSWSSRKQSVVARSSTEAEYRALAMATTDLIWIRTLLSELRIPLHSCSILWCDNQGAITLAYNPAFHARTKHIEIDVHFLREKVQHKQLDIRYIPSEDQPADIFTKALSPSRFSSLCHKLGLVSKEGSQPSGAC